MLIGCYQHGKDFFERVKTDKYYVVVTYRIEEDFIGRLYSNEEDIRWYCDDKDELFDFLKRLKEDKYTPFIYVYLVDGDKITSLGVDGQLTDSEEGEDVNWVHENYKRMRVKVDNRYKWVL